MNTLGIDFGASFTKLAYFDNEKGAVTMYRERLERAYIPTWTAIPKNENAKQKSEFGSRRATSKTIRKWRASVGNLKSPWINLQHGRSTPQFACFDAELNKVSKVCERLKVRLERAGGGGSDLGQVFRVAAKSGRLIKELEQQFGECDAALGRVLKARDAQATEPLNTTAKS